MSIWHTALDAQGFSGAVEVISGIQRAIKTQAKTGAPMTPSIHALAAVSAMLIGEAHTGAPGSEVADFAELVAWYRDNQTKNATVTP